MMADRLAFTEALDWLDMTPENAVSEGADVPMV